MNKAIGMIGISAKAGKVIYGTDSCIDAMKNNKVKLIIVSEEASEKSKKNFIYETIENLSKAIGKKNKVIIGIKDENLANEIEKIINGGDVIG